jgi:hypothetical protein
MTKDYTDAERTAAQVLKMSVAELRHIVDTYMVYVREENRKKAEAKLHDDTPDTLDDAK